MSLEESLLYLVEFNRKNKKQPRIDPNEYPNLIYNDDIIKEIVDDALTINHKIRCCKVYDVVEEIYSIRGGGK